MTSEISAPPERWTYDGMMDDKVTEYPWPGISAIATRKSLDRQLAYSVVTGTPMLLNDGYLVFNQTCFESLREPYSPLRVLINKRYLKVLSRTPEQSLEQMVHHGARQGLQNRIDLVKNPQQWSDTQRVLNTVEEDLREKSGFVGWPRVDLSYTYQRLIQYLMGRSDQELLQDGVPCLTFRKVAERFDSEMSKEAITPRKKWEQIVKDVVNETSGTLEEINRLMQLANEVYHLNFGTGLRARPPENLPKNAEIALQTRTSAAFSPFHRSHTAKASAATTPVVPEVSLPWCVDYSKRGLLGSLFDKDQPIGKCRRDYLKLRADYRAGSVDAEEMVAKKGKNILDSATDFR